MPGMPVIIGDLVLDPCVFDKYAPLARARSAARCSNITLLAMDETLNRLLSSNDKAIAFPFNPQEAASRASGFIKPHMQSSAAL